MIVRACIFDLGGTIVDKYSLTSIVSFRKAFTKININVPRELIRKDMGMNKKEHIEKIMKDEYIQKQWLKNNLELPNKHDIEKIYDSFGRIQMNKISESLTLIPQTIQCMQKLKEKNIKIGVTTGWNKEQMTEVKKLLMKNNIHIDSYVSSTCLNKPGRPHPYMIHQVMDELDIDDPKRIIKIDDTVTGIKEGLNGGCWVVGVSRWSINMDIMNEEEEYKIDMLTHENDNYYQLVKKKQNAKSILLAAQPHHVIDTLEALEPLIDSMNDRGKSLPFQRAMINNYNYRIV